MRQWASHILSLAGSDAAGKHTIFGRIHSGMTVVRRIGLVETEKDRCARGEREGVRG